MANTVTPVGYDTTTLGSWIGVYGADGYLIPNDSTVNPSYCTPVITGTTHDWQNPSSDIRALQKSATPSSRINSCWFHGTAVLVDCNISAGTTSRIGLYFFDGDNTARAMIVDVLDGDTLDVLDTRGISFYYTSPKWLFWDCTGKVRFSVRLTASINPTISGIFFQPISTTGAIQPAPRPKMANEVSPRITGAGAGVQHQLVRGPSWTPTSGGGGGAAGNYGYIA